MVKQVVNNIVEALRGQPLALALVVINLLFITAMGYVLREVSQSIERRDAIISRLADCEEHKK